MLNFLCPLAALIQNSREGPRGLDYTVTMGMGISAFGKGGGKPSTCSVSFRKGVFREWLP